MQYSSSSRFASSSSSRFASSSYSRFASYDYSRGASLFVTLTTEPRQRLFGDVVNGEMALSPYGVVVKAELEAMFAATHGLCLYGHVVMPDHLHFRLYLAPGRTNAVAIALVNRTVGAFKSKTTTLFWRDFGGHGRIWQNGYHDWLCLSREMIDSVERYMAYNAVKWWLRHGQKRQLLSLHEPLVSTRLGRGEYWRGLGAVELLSREQPLVALRVSRRCGSEDIAALKKRLATKAGGFAVVSGFISPGEREVLSFLLSRPEAKLVKVLPWAMPHDWTPSVALMPAIAERRLAIVARGNSPQELSRAACLDLNAKITEIADHSAYVLPGVVKWL